MSEETIRQGLSALRRAQERRSSPRLSNRLHWVAPEFRGTLDDISGLLDDAAMSEYRRLRNDVDAEVERAKIDLHNEAVEKMRDIVLKIPCECENGSDVCFHYDRLHRTMYINLGMAMRPYPHKVRANR